ncbi:MAG: patatin-like phospholipase family protein, partial [Lachnospiraceae bacterium]
MNGLFLQGGGAKGAFEAGAIYALREAGLTFSTVSGTSIGSINGYYLYMGQEEAMKRFYTECNLMPVIQGQVITDVIPNEILIYRLRRLSCAGSAVERFYVNYVHVEDGKKIEIQKDLAKEDKVSQIKAITASSLLPFSLPEGLTCVTAVEAGTKYSDRIMGPHFDADVAAGKYENRDLDGGILNNFFMEPFIT